jgi:hypothetical protein
MLHARAIALWAALLAGGCGRPATPETRSFVLGGAPVVSDFQGIRPIKDCFNDGTCKYGAQILIQLNSGLDTTVTMELYNPATSSYAQVAGTIFAANVYPVGSTPGISAYLSAPYSPGQTLTYRASAQNSSGNSGYATFTLMIPALPSAALSLAAGEAYSGQIALSWLDDLAQVAGYELQRATAPSGPFTTVATPAKSDLLWLDPNLSSSQTFYYQLRAINAAQLAGPWSNVAAVATSPQAAPADRAGSYLVVITNAGTAMPSTGVSAVCDLTNAGSLLSGAQSWFRRETNKFGLGSFFNSMSCATTSRMPRRAHG